ncbi:MAG: efflux RND transporter periplasmic adaptor subunit [Planctomycetota bacterium]
MASASSQFARWISAVVIASLAITLLVSFRTSIVDRWPALTYLLRTGPAPNGNSSFWSELSPGAAQASEPTEVGAESSPSTAARQVLELSPQARRNLGLIVKPLRIQNHWKSLLVPGEFVDRPGLSDRGITSPVAGVVAQVHAFPGDRLQAGDTLFTLRLTSEYLQNAQAELFRATRETELIEAQKMRLSKAAEGGAIAQSRLIELDQQLARQQAAIIGFRQDLLARGLRSEQLTRVTQGEFVTTMEIFVPAGLGSASTESADHFEMQALNVDLGGQVQAGQLLATISNHQQLYIRGQAFKREASQLERAAREGWPVQVEFAEDDPGNWPPFNERLEIRHLANSIDQATRTFSFFIPITNQSHGYEKSGQAFTVWRFRPGQRVRLYVPIEQYSDVLVIPASGVVRDGAEFYVFRQNGDLFDRRAVHVLHEDRLQIVIANDGSVAPGWYIAQNNAAALNRILQAQAGSQTPAGVHVHADGTVHGAH